MIETEYDLSGVTSNVTGCNPTTEKISSVPNVPDEPIGATLRLLWFP
jgi:hypothetical protein